MVTTQHNNNQRTGANLSETCLTTANVKRGRFGFLSSWGVDGQIYAQPLYVPGVRLDDGTIHNVVYVVTMNNTVYAFDADAPGRDSLWAIHVGEPVDFNFFPMYGWFFCKFNITPTIGITSTPVIDPDSRTLYLVAKIRTGARDAREPSTTNAREGGKKVKRGCFDIQREPVEQRLYALDIRNGTNRQNSPRKIEASVPGDAVDAKNGIVTLDSVRELQRPGLLLSQGRVYVAFGSHQDTRPFHGWVLAYDAQSLKHVGTYCTSCFSTKADENGIWQAGAGPAADAQGNVFVMTGNGTWKGGTNDLGNSFVKLDRSLSVVDWFTPSHHDCLSRVDADLGSAGPLLIPNTHFLVGGGKEGVVYLLDANNLGRLQPDGPDRAPTPCRGIPINGLNPPLFSFQATPLYHIDGSGLHRIMVRFEQVIVRARTNWNYRHIHGSPVFWNSASGPTIYLWAEQDVLRGFRLDVQRTAFPGTNPPNRKPMSPYSSAQPAPKGMPGAALSISANGDIDASGIVWAALPLKGNALADIVPGVVRAFAAIPDPATCRPGASCELTELWNSTQSESNDGSCFLFAKFAAPTIANGRVYVPTFSGWLNVYGELPQPVRENTVQQNTPSCRRKP